MIIRLSTIDVVTWTYVENVHNFFGLNLILSGSAQANLRITLRVFNHGAPFRVNVVGAPQSNGHLTALEVRF